MFPTVMSPNWTTKKLVIMPLYVLTIIIFEDTWANDTPTHKLSVEWLFLDVMVFRQRLVDYHISNCGKINMALEHHKIHVMNWTMFFKINSTICKCCSGVTLFMMNCQTKLTSKQPRILKLAGTENNVANLKFYALY